MHSGGGLASGVGRSYAGSGTATVRASAVPAARGTMYKGESSLAAAGRNMRGLGGASQAATPSRGMAVGSTAGGSRPNTQGLSDYSESSRPSSSLGEGGLLPPPSREIPSESAGLAAAAAATTANPSAFAAYLTGVGGAGGAAGAGAAGGVGDLFQVDPVDAFRFRAIVEEGRERIQLVGMLLAEAARHRSGAGEVTDQRRTNISLLMETRHELEVRFEELMSRRRELRGLSNKMRYGHNEAEIREVSSLLQHTAAQIATHLQDQPSSAGGLQKLQRDRAQLLSALDLTIEDLRGGSYGRLNDLISARVAEQHSFAEMRKDQEAHAEALSRLRLELEAEREHFEKSLEEKNALLTRLTQTLKHRRKVTASQRRYAEDSSIAELEAMRREQEIKLGKLRAEITQAEQDLVVDREVSARSLAFLDRRRRLLDDMHADWEGKAAKDVAARTAMIDQVSQTRNAEKAKLRAMMLEWDKEQEEKTTQLELVKRRTIEAEMRKDLHERMHRAQRVIRFYWRVHQRKVQALKKKKKKRAPKADAAAAGAGAASPGRSARRAGEEEEEEEE